VRRRLGNFIIAEDHETLEGVILAKLGERGLTLAVAETFTSGNIASRIAPLRGSETVFRKGVISRNGSIDAGDLLKESGAGVALSVAVQLDEGPDRPEFGATIDVGIADATGTVTRRARLLGGRDWVRVGATELGLDCLRRHLLGLPVDERIDFERR
jgi:nicotinamide-nucleotide amidase